MKTYQIILRNGVQIFVEAEKCDIHRSALGDFIGYSFVGINQEKAHPLFVNISQIDAIVQLEKD